jgi:hypothetical protein
LVKSGGKGASAGVVGASVLRPKTLDPVVLDGWPKTLDLVVPDG